MIIAVGVEYLGGPYSGWQYQGHSDNTVQEQVQKALSFVANEPISVFATGRTDSGVSAFEQVCHFQTNVQREPYNWRQGANTQLPKSIRIHWVKQVDPDFHARFKALYRDYIYIIHRTAVASALCADHALAWRQPLNTSAMAQACTYLKGTCDYSAFRAASCQAKHAVRTIFEADIFTQGDFIAFAIRGNAFLHHMVRNIVGSLLLVGQEDQPPEWIATLLEQGDRAVAGPTAPPQGLYLRTTYFAPRYAIPSTTKTPFGLFDRELAAWPQNPSQYIDYNFGSRLV